MGKAKNKKNGFTLVEIMVVFSIIVILTAISIPIYQGSKKELALQRAVNKLEQDIEKAQEMAMAAKEFQEGSVPSGGYGIYLDLSEPSHYILFADVSANHQYDSEKGELVEAIFLKDEIKIDSLSPASPLNITFTPPDPTTRVNSSISDIGIIILKIDNSTSSVKILPTGLIYVE